MRSISVAQKDPSVLALPSTSGNYISVCPVEDPHLWDTQGSVQQHNHFSEYDFLAPHSESTATSPAASTGVAAVQWFGLLTRDVSRGFPDDDPSAHEGGCLDAFTSHESNATSPLQHATKIIDDQPPESVPTGKGGGEEAMWQASQSIVLLEHEQILFANFLERICSWVCSPPRVENVTTR